MMEQSSQKFGAGMKLWEKWLKKTRLICPDVVEESTDSDRGLFYQSPVNPITSVLYWLFDIISSIALRRLFSLLWFHRVRNSGVVLSSKSPPKVNELSGPDWFLSEWIENKETTYVLRSENGGDAWLEALCWEGFCYQFVALFGNFQCWFSRFGSPILKSNERSLFKVFSSPFPFWFSK